MSIFTKLKDFFKIIFADKETRKLRKLMKKDPEINRLGKEINKLARKHKDH